MLHDKFSLKEEEMALICDRCKVMYCKPVGPPTLLNNQHAKELQKNNELIHVDGGA